MSWLFSRVLVEAYSEGISSDGEPSVQSNGNPIPQAYCAPDKMTRFSRLSRFGMTYAPLTENRGQELLTLYLAGFPAKTSVLRGGGGAGITGSRSGLWKEMARIIGEVRPRYAFIENSPMLTLRGLDTVLSDLAAMGFDANWGVVSAADVGAPHLRERIWIVANATGAGRAARSICDKGNDGCKIKSRGAVIFAESGQTPAPLAHSNSNGKSVSTVNAEQVCKPDMAHSNSSQRQGNKRAEREQPTHSNTCGAGWWASEPNVGRVVNGMGARVDRLKAIGNGQVPAVAATAFRLLTEDL